MISGFILRNHEDSPIDLEKIQVLIFNDHEYPQWTKSKMFGKKGRKYRLVQTTCTKYGSYPQNYQHMRKDTI